MISKFGKFVNQIDIGGLRLNLPVPGGVAAGGLLAAVGFFFSILFSFMMVFWVGLSIFAAIKIISSQGSPEGIESGTKTIRNIWVGIGMGLMFFVIISIIGVFLGFGSVYEWSTKLAQCGGSDSKFFFQLQEETASDWKEKGANSIYIACCDFGDGFSWKTGNSANISLSGAIVVSQCPIAEFIDI